MNAISFLDGETGESRTPPETRAGGVGGDKIGSDGHQHIGAPLVQRVGQTAMHSSDVRYPSLSRGGEVDRKSTRLNSSH